MLLRGAEPAHFDAEPRPSRQRDQQEAGPTAGAARGAADSVTCTAADASGADARAAPPAVARPPRHQRRRRHDRGGGGGGRLEETATGRRERAPPNRSGCDFLVPHALGHVPKGHSSTWIVNFSSHGRMVALSICTTHHPLHTRFAKRFGASFFEATMRPNPRRAAAPVAVVTWWPSGCAISLNTAPATPSHPLLLLLLLFLPAPSRPLL